MLTATTPVTETKLSLEDSEISTATVSVSLNTDSAYVSNSFDISCIADPEDNQVWLSLSQHGYTSLDGLDSVSTRSNLLSQHLSKEEAFALLAVLSKEIAKLID